MDAVLRLQPLQAEREPAPLGIDLDDLDVDVLSGTHYLRRILHMVLGQLGDVDETLYALLDLYEGPEGNQLGDLAVHDLVDLAILEHLLPGIFLRLLQAQRDALPFAIDVQHPHGHLLADGEYLGRVIDVTPREFGDVDQTVDAFQVYESTEIHDVGDGAGDQIADVHAVEDLLPDTATLFLQHGPAAEHHVVAKTVQLDDPALEALPEELVQVGHPADIDQRSRQEAAHAKVEDEAALDHFDDVTGHRGAFFGSLLDALPGPFEARPLPRKDQSAVRVLFGEDEGIDDIAHRHFFRRIHRLPDRQLVRGDHSLALVADVDEDFVLVDTHHSPGDDIPLVEAHHRRLVVGDHLAVDLDHEILATL